MAPKEPTYSGTRAPVIDVELPTEQGLEEFFGMSEEQVKLHVVVKPLEAGWQMGAPVEIPLRGTETFYDLQDMIDKYKGTDFSRYDIIVPPSREPVPPQKHGWGVSRIGIHSGSEVKLVPKYPNLFLWHPLPVYEEYWVGQVYAFVLGRGDAGAPYEDIKEQVPRPRPLINRRPKSLLRRHPDIFFIEVEDRTGRITVFLNLEQRLPMYMS
mmetsp:Transcript_33661/g.106394  ORF Transcript_33661/g.106394 Transcript_33661/m.106394 type:complete len:211 (-) Transcript_33661:654-1286(-)